MAKPKGVAEILRVLDDTPRSRAELMDVARLDHAEWYQAIRYIMDAGLAEKTGSKRGTRYTRVGSDAGSPVSTSGQGTGAVRRGGALAATAYHDVVLEALRDLGTPVLETSAMIAVGCDGDGGEEDLAVLLARACVDVVDMRSRGGCLWVVDSETARSVLTSPPFQGRFEYAASSRACEGHAAWWTRD